MAKSDDVSKKYHAFLGKANAYIEQDKIDGICPTAEQARVNLDKIGTFYQPKMHVSRVIDAEISLPNRNISLRIYDPQPEQITSVIIYMHGGGHMCGIVDLYDTITRRLAVCTAQLVVSIDYRLAPEYPYPWAG